jgi:hypothetical protein
MGRMTWHFKLKLRVVTSRLLDVSTPDSAAIVQSARHNYNDDLHTYTFRLLRYAGRYRTMSGFLNSIGSV